MGFRLPQKAKEHIPSSILRILVRFRRRLHKHLFESNKPRDFPHALKLGIKNPNDEVSFPDLRVACILDEFSHLAWSSEFNLIELSIDNWAADLKDVDFLLVESAWQGNGGLWQYKLVGPNAPSTELVEIVEFCKSAGIPTVFWNKEDPPHFSDFAKTAKIFDYIFTTDADMLSAYRSLAGSAHIGLLPFAAQPAIHSPAGNGLRRWSRDVAFAGTYFQHKFPERRRQMDLLLGAAAEGADQGYFSFDIFSRHKGGELKYQFPNELSTFIRGSLPYANMISAYKEYKVFLNVNTVTQSPTMCARRVFEISSCGTSVITTPSNAISQFFSPEEITVVKSKQEAKSAIRALNNSSYLRARQVHLAQRKIWENHTYYQRAETILTNLDLLPEVNNSPKVSIICATNRDKTLTHLFEQVSAQSYRNLELVVLGHGIDLSDDLYSRAKSLGVRNLKVLHSPAETSLGECLNALIQASTGDVIAKFDDDDYYFENYVRDQLNILRITKADLVGKSSIYFYLRDKNLMALRWPDKSHMWTDFVAGATLFGWKSTFTEIPFRALRSGEDSQFLHDAKAKNCNIYSSDAFNYIAVRGADGHTWQISDWEILGYSRAVTTGFCRSLVEI